MIPGNDKYFECPICTTTVYNPTLISGNTFGASLFSDGKREAPMLPDFPSITACPNCDHIYWLNQQSECGPKEDNSVYRAEFLNAIQLEEAIKNGLAEELEDEKYLRMQIMWSINDRLREGMPMLPTDELKSIWENNQVRLLQILDARMLNDRILIAEIHRNNGDFDRSLELINTIENPDLLWLVNAFKDQIEKKNKWMFQFDIN